MVCRNSSKILKLQSNKKDLDTKEDNLNLLFSYLQQMWFNLLITKSHPLFVQRLTTGHNIRKDSMKFDRELNLNPFYATKLVKI